MPQVLNMTWKQVYQHASYVSKAIHEKYLRRPVLKAYAIPNGGIPAAQAIQYCLSNTSISLELVEEPNEADIYIDDLIDSGATIERVTRGFGQKNVFTLIDKRKIEGVKPWISFPWERMKDQKGPEENIVRILQHIGEDPTREGLRDTPDRVVRSYSDLFSGYRYDEKSIADIFKTFEDGACDEMVLLKNVEFVSFCEHHIMPFTGSTHIAYLPQGKVAGVSKLARILDIYSRRLQIQEKLTQQITKALDKHLNPLGSACVIEAVHECMTCRGVRKQSSVMVTSSLTGAFRDQAVVRQEFFSMLRM